MLYHTTYRAAPFRPSLCVGGWGGLGGLGGYQASELKIQTVRQKFNNAVLAVMTHPLMKARNVGKIF